MAEDADFEPRLLAAAKQAANLGLLLRDFWRDYPNNFSREELLDLAASVIFDGFRAPPDIHEIDVRLGLLHVADQAGSWPVMPKPETLQ